MQALRVAALGAVTAIAIGCSCCVESPPDDSSGADTVESPWVFGAAGFFGSPFPDELRIKDGAVSMALFASDGAPALVKDSLALLDGKAKGFSTTAGLFAQSKEPAVIECADVTLRADDGPAKGEDVPISCNFAAETTTFGSPNLFSIVPRQGDPLRPSTTYEWLVEGTRVARFRTWDPLRPLASVVKKLHSLPLPKPTTAVKLIETHADFCVYETRYDMPVFQSGTPPYAGTGGGIDDAKLQVQRHEAARLFVTIPRKDTPKGGWPVVVFVRTGGGGDRPMIDRGVRDKDGVVKIPGSGPAKMFAQAGFAGAQLDGPLGGIRNPTGADEQLLIFNFGNLAAMRGNLLQSAAEMTLVPRLLASLSIDTSGCKGATKPSQSALDIKTIALMGHSMGATIAPLSIAFAKDYGALILSGAGGSWIENILHKQLPFAVKPIAEALLNYTKTGESLHRHDPVLSLVQWVGEIADPPIFARAVTDGWIDRKPPHVLMLQGIADRYIMPTIANATSIAYRLDLGGKALDQEHDETKIFPSAATELATVGGKTIPLPAKGNRDDGKRTAVVVQHLEDGVEDGHEVAFQVKTARDQYECFLKTWRATGVPMVPAAKGACHVK